MRVVGKGILHNLVGFSSFDRQVCTSLLRVPKLPCISAYSRTKRSKEKLTEVTKKWKNISKKNELESSFTAYCDTWANYRSA